MAVDLGGPGALPVAAKIHRRAAPHRQTGDAVDLITVAGAAQVLTPGRFLRVTNQIRSRSVMVMSHFAATQAGEVGFGAIRASAVYTIAIMMVDPPHGETGMQHVPGGTFIGMHRGPFGDALADRGHSIRLGREDSRQSAPATFAHGVDLRARPNVVLYWTSITRQKASMLLPLTSLPNTVIAIRSVRIGNSCHANKVPDVTEKSARHALQRQRALSGEPRQP
jgi:hypothetical protein